jgi:hypothetical protein
VPIPASATTGTTTGIGRYSASAPAAANPRPWVTIMPPPSSVNVRRRTSSGMVATAIWSSPIM